MILIPINYLELQLITTKDALSAKPAVGSAMEEFGSLHPLSASHEDLQLNRAVASHPTSLRKVIEPIDPTESFSSNSERFGLPCHPPSPALDIPG